MISLDPILAVKDVALSVQWYQTVFGLKPRHGGDTFEIMVSEQDEVVLCLHKWGEHEHPSLSDVTIPSGNGLLLYFRTHDLEAVFQKAKAQGHPVLEEISVSPNSMKKECSFLDPDGYHITVSEYHEYRG
ncbi:MAG: VOC family protein [Bacteroidota bacterium]